MKESLYDFYKKRYINKDIVISRKKTATKIISKIDDLLDSLGNMSQTEHLNILDYINISKELKLIKNKLYLDINDYIICEHYILKRYKKHKIRIKKFI